MYKTHVDLFLPVCIFLLQVLYTGRRGRPRKVKPGEQDPHAEERKKIREKLFRNCPNLARHMESKAEAEEGGYPEAGGSDAAVAGSALTGHTFQTAAAEGYDVGQAAGMGVTATTTAPETYQAAVSIKIRQLYFFLMEGFN